MKEEAKKDRILSHGVHFYLEQRSAMTHPSCKTPCIFPCRWARGEEVKEEAKKRGICSIM